MNGSTNLYFIRVYITKEIVFSEFFFRVRFLFCHKTGGSVYLLLEILSWTINLEPVNRKDLNFIRASSEFKLLMAHLSDQ